MSKFWDIKDQKEIQELQYISPVLFLVFADLVRFCYDSKLPAPVITSICRTQEEEAQAGAESTSHLTRRALDLRSTHYTKSQMDIISNYLNQQWGPKYGAINAQGQVRLCVYHKIESVKGQQFHWHIQVHRKFELPEWTGLP